MTGAEEVRTPEFTWRRVAEADFPLLGGWLARPHVARWWNHETSPEAVRRDFGPTARGEEPAEDLLAHADGVPIGLVQRCRIADYPEYLDELRELAEVPESAMTVDYLVGEPDLVGRGVGSAMIRAALADTWAAYPEADCVIVPVAAANAASWRALEKAGLRRVAEGELTPDNPANGTAHYIYRVDRPR
ncbi:GNAT family N-acetyltransferase [Nocardia sp. bgisy134]|uniref:GNAT family N-acetyltransferase n=1 Tax=unclassified Nocardia TaxID=2637762 RepID=UPI003D716436